ncbi:hypothetical protein NIES593_14675 [Hydrococcus rivularis NIES-593]|uniref:Uncharacterized protein n=1 Tax=Hydrococcus rivularis NIES-593 TaxID=1921803 RepID=A0A1U7HDL9_9CYAN|nr:hypothetical protein [Hydrococcus rivularis]OKH21676.1 hypothetical protein NIES593_14675 [Hydrococcus rivularis NIES-593]
MVFPQIASGLFRAISVSGEKVGRDLLLSEVFLDAIASVDIVSNFSAIEAIEAKFTWGFNLNIV